MKNFYIKLMFLIIVMVLVTVSLITYRNLSNYIQEENLIRHSSEVFSALDQSLSTIKDAEIGYKGFMLTHDTLYLRPYYSSLRTLPAHMRTLDSLVKKNIRQAKKVDTLEYLINNQFNIIDKTLMSTRHSVTPLNTSGSRLLIDGIDNMERITTIIGRISEEEEKVFRMRLSSETDFRNVAPIALLFYALFALAGVALLFTKVIDALEKQRVAETQLNENILQLKSEVGVRELTQKTLRSVLDNSLDSIMAFKAIRDKDRKIIDFQWTLSNSIGSKFMGQSEKQLIGSQLLKIWPGNKSQGLFNIFEEVVQSGQPMQFEKFCYLDGFDGWYSFAVVKLEDGFMVTFSDITEQKSQRLVMEERGLLLNEAEALANMGSWKWDEATQRLLWSNGLYKILNKNPETYVPSWDSFLENVYREDYTLMEDFLKKIGTANDGLGIEYRVELEGRLKFLSIASKSSEGLATVRHDKLGTVLDVTKQKTYESEMKQHTIDLQRSNEDLEQFAYVASHDLQEPLRKIRSFGDRLTTRYRNQLEDQGIDFIQRMQSAATRMQTLIEDLLSYSRVSRANDIFQPLDINLIMSEVLDDLDVQIKREGALIKMDNIPTFIGDRIQIKRLLQNLINNAIKFHKPEHKPIVGINSRFVKSSEIESELGISLPDVPYIRISVKDNGIGFEERYVERIFNIFQRLHGRLEFEGTGIGLAICRKIVMNHKGYITVHSKVNVGSEFIVVLPVN
jgi:signal transduction histidine kinase/CHASE3 domain sensor protein